LIYRINGAASRSTSLAKILVQRLCRLFIKRCNVHLLTRALFSQRYQLGSGAHILAVVMALDMAAAPR
jgi:hypothetical protein